MISRTCHVDANLYVGRACGATTVPVTSAIVKLGSMLWSTLKCSNAAFRTSYFLLASRNASCEPPGLSGCELKHFRRYRLSSSFLVTSSVRSPKKWKSSSRNTFLQAFSTLPFRPEEADIAERSWGNRKSVGANALELKWLRMMMMLRKMMMMMMMLRW